MRGEADLLHAGAFANRKIHIVSRLLDVASIMWMYRGKFGRFPNLVAPRTHTERMQVAKLTWRSPLLPLFVDKVRAKDFVAREFGADLVTPNLHVGDRLPPRAERNWSVPYVIKVNHASKANIFVRGEAERDWDAIEPRIERWLRRTYGKRMGEWAYSQVPRKVLVEPFLGPLDTTPIEYKISVFGGRVATIGVTLDRYGDRRNAFYDRDWQLLPFTFLPKPGPLAAQPVPQQFERLLAISEEVGKRMPFVRVDFMEVEGRPHFSEITVYANSGMQPLDPPEYDRILGALWGKGKPAQSW